MYESVAKPPRAIPPTAVRARRSISLLAGRRHHSVHPSAAHVPVTPIRGLTSPEHWLARAEAAFRLKNGPIVVMRPHGPADLTPQ